MFLFRLFILQMLIVLSVVPLYAYDGDGDASARQLVITSLSEEKIKNDLGGISDSRYNEMADEAVRKNVTLFSEKIRERFSVYLNRSGKYIEMMKTILKEHDVPEEIVFLPLIESGFNPYAYSPARAAGYWQFIASTAKHYGLEINWWKDERRDPVKSTVAAASYLKDLYKMFGSWNLAMAAYNAGEGKILRALNKNKSDDYWSLLNTRYIKNETKNYVPKFIAASLIASNPGDFGFDDLDYHAPLQYEKVTLTSPVDIEVIAECTETSVEVIREMNPELRRWCTPPDVSEYTLRIPEGIKEVFLKNLSDIPEERRFSVDLYTVKKGDTFKTISNKTGVPVQVIYDLNNMEKIIPLAAGMKLYLPPKGKYALDRDDKASVKKASYKQKKKSRIKSKKSVRKVSYARNKKEPARYKKI
jgi:membrane-bound lytic murein transglycosylase D